MTHMESSAIVFRNPRQLALEKLTMQAPRAGDIEVEVSFSGISTGTERLLWDGSMSAFPGMGYPLVPGYETVGRITGVNQLPEHCDLKVGDTVFVPGSQCFEGVHNLFGGAGAHLVVPHGSVVRVADHLGTQACLLALAATAYHSVALGGTREPATPPSLIIGHGIMGRLLARLTVAAGLPAPTVWETSAARRESGQSYPVIHPDEDDRKDYAAIYDLSGDADILDRVIPRLRPGGEVVLAGYYKEKISFAYAPAFMREAQIRVAAEWKRADLLAVTELVHTGVLSLDGLITHTQTPGQAHAAYEAAFDDPQCLKMILDWRH